VKTFMPFSISNYRRLWQLWPRATGGHGQAHGHPWKRHSHSHHPHL